MTMSPYICEIRLIIFVIAGLNFRIIIFYHNDMTDAGIIEEIVQVVIKIMEFFILTDAHH